MNTTFFYWGPLLTCSAITPEQIIIAKEVCNQSKLDSIIMEHTLISKLNNEMLLLDENTEKFIKIIDSHIKTYLNTYDSVYTNGEKLVYKHIEYQNPWSNFQQKGEYRPPHIHNGDLSYVLYVDIPEKLKQEHEENLHSGQKRGSVIFSWASDSHCGFSSQVKPNNCYDFFPKNGDLYVFPSYLTHYSMNFFSDCVRVSVSGNVFLK